MAVLGNLSTLSEGLASLIGDDRDSGALQSKAELCEMLYALSGITNHARAHLEVANTADILLSGRELGCIREQVEVSHG